MTVKFFVCKIKEWCSMYPILRGMASYSLTWPTGSIIQQTYDGNSWGSYDWWGVLRYSLYGSLFVAPTFYGWIRLSSAMWPMTSFQTSVIKAVVETISFTPLSMTCFFFMMSLLEMKTLSEAIAETRDKFPPTYKVAVCVWPFITTVNFNFIPERNRVPFISVCSLLWIVYMAEVKHLENPPYFQF